jgi:hypothetical protein
VLLVSCCPPDQDSILNRLAPEDRASEQVLPGLDSCPRGVQLVHGSFRVVPPIGDIEHSSITAWLKVEQHSTQVSCSSIFALQGHLAPTDPADVHFSLRFISSRSQLRYIRRSSSSTLISIMLNSSSVSGDSSKFLGFMRPPVVCLVTDCQQQAEREYSAAKASQKLNHAPSCCLYE